MRMKAFYTGLTGSARAAVKRVKRAGQVTIELLLVLPVFMLLLFFIMEIGNIAFQTILAHHCAYELARIGSLMAGPNGGDIAAGEISPNTGGANIKMTRALGQMFKPSAGTNVKGYAVATLYDQQAKRMNWDWIVTLNYEAKLIFPGSSYVLSDPPKGSKKKNIKVMMRMPIESAYFN